MKTPTTRKRKKRREDLPTHAHTYRLQLTGPSNHESEVQNCFENCGLVELETLLGEKTGMPLGDRLVPRV